MRGIFVFVLIGLGIAGLIRQSLVAQVRASEQRVNRYEQMPSWSHFRIIQLRPPQVSEASDAEEIPDEDHSRYV